MKSNTQTSDTPIAAHQGHNVYPSLYTTAWTGNGNGMCYRVVGENTDDEGEQRLLLDVGDTYLWVPANTARPTI